MADLKDLYDEMKQKMVKPIINFENELKKIRGGRISSGIIDSVRVEAENKVSPIKALANINLLDARTIIISPWDKSNLQAIEKALLKENLNVTPSNDGKVIKLVFPQMTEETRKDLVKNVKGSAEDTKVAIRNIRRDFIEKLKTMEKNSEIIEDEKKEAEDKLQNYTNKAIAKVDEIFAEKEKEIMTV